MSWRLTARVMLAICTAVGAVSVAASGSALTLDCPRARHAPVADGAINEWTGPPQLAIQTAEDWQRAGPEFAEYGGAGDVSAAGWLSWDERALYLALSVRDDVPIRVRSVAEIDSGDSVVISFSGEGVEEVDQFVVALLRGTSLVYRAEPRARAGDARAIARGIWARPEDTGGTRVVYELIIPWSELSAARPVAGGRFALAISICDDDGAGLEGCLERSSVVVLSAAAVTPSPPVPPPPPDRALDPIFAAPELVRFDRACFVLREQPTLLFGGGVDYLHLPREEWSDRLQHLRGAGMNLVGVTALWSRHQPTREPPDLSDLRGFLELCRAEGLLVQLDIGPYFGERWEAGGVPEWVVAAGRPDEESDAARAWVAALLPLVREFQLTSDGPIALVIARPLPDENGVLDADELERLMAACREADIRVPVLTANAPAARDNTRQVLANMLDTLSFYTPLGAAEVVAGLSALEEENGPPVISSFVGDYGDAGSARRSAAALRAALGKGTASVVVSDFAPGMSGRALLGPGGQASGVIDPAGAAGAGYGELRLVGSFLHQFGRKLAHAAIAEEAVSSDDSAVTAVARLTAREGFIFLWNDDGESRRHVRLSYREPGTEEEILIPKVGAINLAPAGAKILPLGVPVGRGVLRYATSEVAGIHQIADRTLLVVYGDPGTAGEICLRWPGEPLVTGEVVRQHWDPSTKALTLDYYHGNEDKYLLVDELEIAVLSRERAAQVAAVAGEAGTDALVTGARAVRGSREPEAVALTLDLPEGTTNLSLALAEQPSSVSLDGEPVESSFSTQERVLMVAATTESFEDERRPSSLLGKVERWLDRGRPRLEQTFEEALFMPDSRSEAGVWREVGSTPGTRWDLGLVSGDFARLRARFRGEGYEVLAMSGADAPRLVFINGRFVPELSGPAPEGEARISELVGPGENVIEVVLHRLPNAKGHEGMRSRRRGLSKVALTGERGEMPIDEWQLSAGLGGEAEGWQRPETDLRRWYRIGLGAWSEQRRDLAEVRGVGWYQVPFALPPTGAWRVPYNLTLSLRGTAAVYLNGQRIAICEGDGDCVLPLPPSLLDHGGKNVLSLAVYGFGMDAGLLGARIAADRDGMTRERTLRLGFPAG